MDSSSTVQDKGIFYLIISMAWSHIFYVDVHMGSPHTPPKLYGSSRITGGILCGHALGNTLNVADHKDVSMIRSFLFLGKFLFIILRRILPT